ncbi:transcription elongation factor 1, partial [Bisporella sp. PMI_857]
LDKTFTCLFCNKKTSIQVKLNLKIGLGKLNCRVCDVEFDTTISNLSKEIDVYSDWVDTCHTAAKMESRMMGMVNS